MDLESAGGLAIHTILSKLGPKDTSAVACVSKRFNIYASDESHWARFCADELDLSSPQDPLGNPIKSFKEAYEKWKEAFHMYPWPLVKRVKRCWDQLRSWLAINFPEALSTLRKGASEDQINELEKSLNVKLPIPTKLLYRFCDGQKLPSEELFKDRMHATSLGLIGGYCFYNHIVNVFLLPLKQIIGETNYVRRRLGFKRKSEYIVVASSFTSGEKIFFLNCGNSQLYVGSRDLTAHKEMIPCVPDSLLGSVNVSKGSSEQQDGMLLWLEEHGRRLETGFIKIREEKKIKSICQFPEQAPLCSTAVTNGIQVRASACFVPELSAFKYHPEMYFSYSIRISLVPEGCLVNGMKFESCQLYWRHWLIRGSDHVESDVNGEAVIGKFPLLSPGEKEFVYQSCTPLKVTPGSVEGSFTFVPGRLADPKGSPFKVEVASFPLSLPDYIF